MKKGLLVIGFALLGCIVQAQSGVQVNKKEYFTLGVFVDPYATYKQGPVDMGVEIEYVGPIYAKAGFEFFPAITPGYFDLHGAIGINVMFGRFNPVRTYAGLKVGVIWRESLAVGETYGPEIGIDVTLSENFYVGANFNRVFRGEGEPLGWPDYWQNNATVKFGYKWDWKK